MKKSLLTLTTLLVMAMFASSVLAWGPGDGRRMSGNADGRGYCQKAGGFAGMANLSKEQQDQLRALHQKFIDDTYELRSTKFQKRTEIRMLMETSNPDRTKLLKLYDDMASIEKQLRVKRVDLQLASKKIAPELGSGFGFGPKSGRHHGRADRWCSNKANGQGFGRFAPARAPQASSPETSIE